MSDLLAARTQMAVTLGFHIVLACLGVGMPLLLLVAEGLAIRRYDPTWRALARRWSKVFAVLFAVGAVSGTVLSLGGSGDGPHKLTNAGGRTISSLGRHGAGLHEMKRSLANGTNATAAASFGSVSQATHSARTEPARFSLRPMGQCRASIFG